MLTHTEVLAAVCAGRMAACIDSRDYSRLVDYFATDDWTYFGFAFTGSQDEQPAVREWTRENILENLRSDVAFGIEKAEGERGISSWLMHSVVKMWLWILEDDLQHDAVDCGYGLGFFRTVEHKYCQKAEAARGSDD